MPKRFFHILLICCICQKITAQSVTGGLDDSTSGPIYIYYQALGEQSPLYNGSEYLEYTYQLQEGHPFFGSLGWTKGVVHFDGMTFRDVPMLYDLVKDQLVIPDFQNLHKINLPADKVEGFTISGHTFVRLVPDSSTEIKTGFYELLYHSKTDLFVKRQKKIEEKHLDVRIDNVVISQDIYYVRKDGVYHPIKNKADLIHVLKDRRKEIAQRLKDNGLKFRQNPEQTMLIAVEYYNRLNN